MKVVIFLLALAACAAAAHKQSDAHIKVSVGQLKSLEKSVPVALLAATSVNTHRKPAAAHKVIVKRDLKDTMLKQLKNGEMPSSLYTVNRHDMQKRHVKLPHLSDLKNILRDRRDINWNAVNQGRKVPVLHAAPQRVRRGARLHVINRLAPVVKIQPLKRSRRGNTPAFVKAMLDMKN